jgi:NAD+ synthase/NAD+ synthase (glutamine-hydrolysing)
VKIALAQINPTVGDFSGNAQKILDNSARAAEQGAELVMFPELSVCGYPPADLLEKPSFVERSEDTVQCLAEATEKLGIAVLCGAVTASRAGAGKRVSNSALVLAEGRVAFQQQKMLLPFYDVFDEQRYFEPAKKQCGFTLGAERLALTICEDAWNDKTFWQTRLYAVDPVDELMKQGTSLILNISASPYWRGKRQTRLAMLSAIARRHRTPVLMVNQVGGNDSLIFDGTSLAFDADGELFGQGRSFEEDLLLVDTASLQSELHSTMAGLDAGTYQALVLGTRDYIRKCSFSKAVIGLSGGIDSALVAAIAVDALGKENVLAVGMPSPYSSPGSIADSEKLAANLGVNFEVLKIGGIFSEYTTTLSTLFAGREPDITEENLQSRIRGALLMAISNKLGALVLTTGNKSEMATGYCTLYGDMVGALAVIGDVIKTNVYRLARYVNREAEVIPEAILEKPPSAELRPGQVDTDSLPPYDVLDPIIEAYVERYETPENIAQQYGIDLELVRSVVKLVERSEYKRQQAAPVLKVTPKSFGMGRRFPIAVKVQV